VRELHRKLHSQSAWRAHTNGRHLAGGAARLRV